MLNKQTNILLVDQTNNEQAYESDADNNAKCP